MMHKKGMFLREINLIHPRWCRISSIGSRILLPLFTIPFLIQEILTSDFKRTFIWKKPAFISIESWLFHRDSYDLFFFPNQGPSLFELLRLYKLWGMLASFFSSRLNLRHQLHALHWGHCRWYVMLVGFFLVVISSFNLHAFHHHVLGYLVTGIYPMAPTHERWNHLMLLPRIYTQWALASCHSFSSASSLD